MLLMLLMLLMMLLMMLLLLLLLLLMLLLMVIPPTCTLDIATGDDEDVEIIRTPPKKKVPMDINPIEDVKLSIEAANFAAQEK